MHPPPAPAADPRRVCVERQFELRRHLLPHFRLNAMREQRGILCAVEPHLVVI